MGSYWIGFIFGSAATMSVIAAVQVGAPPWAVALIAVAWALIIAVFAACQRPKTSERDIVLSRLRKKMA